MKPLVNRIFRKRLWIFFLLAFSAVSPLLGYAQENIPASKNTAQLKVTWEYAGWSLPFLVAMDQGLFKQAGVNIAAKKVGGPMSLNISETDIVNGHGLYLMNKKGVGPEHVKFIHTISMRSAGDMIRGFVVKKEAVIKKWKDFKGKKKLIALGSSTDSLFLVDFLRQKGLTVFGRGADITGFAIGSSRFAKDPHIIALYGWSKDIRKYMETQPNSYMLLGTNLECIAITDPYYVAVTYVNSKTYVEKAKLVKVYLQVIDQAIDIIRQHPIKALAVIPKYTKWKPEDASRMGVYHFDKTDESPDFAALQKILKKNPHHFYFSGIEPDKESRR
jgi:ABC-type nitrate/sulfonate/bicarbonate transport system substrate-binding protein